MQMQKQMLLHSKTQLHLCCPFTATLHLHSGNYNYKKYFGFLDAQATQIVLLLSMLAAVAKGLCKIQEPCDKLPISLALKLQQLSASLNKVHDCKGTEPKQQLRKQSCRSTLLQGTANQSDNSPWVTRLQVYLMYIMNIELYPQFVSKA